MPLRKIYDACNSLRDNPTRLGSILGGDIDFLAFVVKHAHLSNAQLFQDLWVLYETGLKEGGYFVEFGVCDGKNLSNTLTLEKRFGWHGAVAEPGRCWRDDLFQSRSCYISTKCIFTETGATLEFNEAKGDAGLSTIATFTDSDRHAAARASGDRYDVQTISLEDFLQVAGAPRQIDYMSVDTEGSELDILQAFDFSRYDIRMISIEHNFTDKRGEIFDFMSGKGYRRKFIALSQWDDWYIKD